CLIIGCSSAGEIATEYQQDGLVAVVFEQDEFRAEGAFIAGVAEYGSSEAKETIEGLRSRLASRAGEDFPNSFAFCLIDGLSVSEERFVANTHAALEGIPLLGGSAGDNLRFERTTVFCGERYGSEAAVLLLLRTNLDFELFHLAHFSPTEIELVITKADLNTRTVFEIDGGPANEEYAALLGVSTDALTTTFFSFHPLMLQVGDEWYVRAIQQVNPDGSLTFFCAIEEGVPLCVGSCEDITVSINKKVKEFQKKFQDIRLTIGCDCILRRLEMERNGNSDDVLKALQPLNFLGFSTYGEQLNSLHVSQTLTGVVLGKR
ncbi:MAG: FIST C-terminal domain-containing protein, partial [Bdellovibrionales bacterium]|nr:FIST C-terminal domain-containing protein [Bdellovibrionales bacterium]